MEYKENIYKGKQFLHAESNCKKVVVKEGTESIASGAFDSCSAETVILPNSLRKIEDSAFLRARQLKEINLPEGLESIGFAAFRYCVSLQEIILPKSLKHLGAYAFYGCQKLETININGTFTWNEAWFDKQPFSSHWGYYNPFGYIQSIKYITNTNPNFVVKDGALYNAEMTVLFRCSVLSTKINLPDSLEYILEFAFDNCRYLEKIELPQQLNFIGKSAFGSCVYIREIIIPPKISRIPESCFSLCTKLAHLRLHEYIEDIEEYAFFGCYQLEFIDYPRGQKTRLYQLLLNSGFEPVVHSPLRYTECCQAISEMLRTGNVSKLREMVSDDVKMVVQGERSITGIDSIVKELESRFTTDEKDSFSMYEIHKHNTFDIDYIQMQLFRKKEPTYQKWMLMIYIEQEKITKIIIGKSLYGVSPKGRYPWEQIDVKNSIKSIPNQIPCIECGRLSEELVWVKVGVDTPMGGSRGILSFCPHCHKQIQYKEELHYIANR